MNKLCFLISIFVITTLLTSCQKESKPNSFEIKNDFYKDWLTRSLKRNEDSLEKKQVLEKAYFVNNQIKNDSVRGRNLLLLAHEYYKINDYSYFKKLNKEAFKLAQIQKDTFAIADAHWNFGNYFFRKSINDSAFYHYNRASKYFAEIDRVYYEGKMLYNMALIQGRLKDYTGSEKSTFQSISKFKPEKKYLNLYRAYNHLGILFYELDEFERSKYYYDQAEKYLSYINEQNTFKEGLLNNLGLLYQKQNNYKKSKETFFKGLNSPSLKKNDIRLYARLLDNLAYTKLLDRDTLQVKQYLFEALKIRDSINNLAGIIISNIHIANFHIFERDTSNAILRAQQARNSAEQSENLSSELTSLKLLGRIDLKNSASYLKKYVRLSDSITNQERKERNKFTRIRFETDEYILETKRLSEQKIWIIIASIIITGTLCLLYLLKIQHSKNKELKFEKKQQASNEEIYQLLIKQQYKIEEGRKKERNRISSDLHDGVLGRLFGTRMGIGLLNLKGNSNQIKNLNTLINELQNIEKEIRTISHELSQDILDSNLGFPDLIKSLLKKQSLVGGFNFKFSNDPEIDWDSIHDVKKIHIYRITQESLNNIVKHSKATDVDISFKQKEQKIIFNLYDNGIGFDIKANFKNGIGIRNIKSRNTILGGDISIISSNNKGTSIKIVFSKNLTHD